MYLVPKYILLGFCMAFYLICTRAQKQPTVVVLPNPFDEGQWQFTDRAGNTFEIESRPVTCPLGAMYAPKPQ